MEDRWDTDKRKDSEGNTQQHEQQADRQLSKEQKIGRQHEQPAGRQRNDREEKNRQKSRDFRKDFPLFRENPVIYLDNAATTQRPACVMQAEETFYREYNANPLRGIYALGQEATERYEEAREAVRAFINAASAEEIIFTRNTTESLNLVAYSYGLTHLNKGDEIVVSILEHHSNLLPWQRLAKLTGAELKFLECEPDGQVTEEQIDRAFSNRTKLMAITRISNVLGRETKLARIIAQAKKSGAAVVVDAAQSVAHMPTDVQSMDADFLAFSGHKMFGPMGIGVLYGKKALLREMEPFLLGGEMIQSVTRTDAVWAELPHRFEAGTVNAAGAWGLKAAMEYISNVGFEAIRERELALTAQALTGLQEIPHIQIQGADRPEDHSGILSFTVEGVHPHDVSSILDADGIAVRAGHHCAQPLLEHLGVSSTTRASIAFYNTAEEINMFLASVESIRRRMGYGK